MGLSETVGIDPGGPEQLSHKVSMLFCGLIRGFPPEHLPCDPCAQANAAEFWSFAAQLLRNEVSDAFFEFAVQSLNQFLELIKPAPRARSGLKLGSGQLRELECLNAAFYGPSRDLPSLLPPQLPDNFVSLSVCLSVISNSLCASWVTQSVGWLVSLLSYLFLWRSLSR